MEKSEIKSKVFCRVKESEIHKKLKQNKTNTNDSVYPTFVYDAAFGIHFK